MKFFTGLLKLILALFLMAVLVGFVSPKKYSGHLEYTFDLPASSVWLGVNDIHGRVERRPEIERVEIVASDFSGVTEWKEFTRFNNELHFKVVDRTENEKLVIEMVDSTIGMTGTWTYELAKDPDGDEQKTLLVIKEESSINNLWLRSAMTLAGRGIYLRFERDGIISQLAN